MTAQRARALLLSLGAPLLAVLAVRGQGQLATGFTIVENLGLPAVYTGALVGEPHPVNLNASQPRGALGAALASAARLSPQSGVAYMHGKVIVKFRDGGSAALHSVSLRSVSPTATVSERPDYADFDIITIDPSEDVEAVAAAFREREDVEYAQPAYLMHPMLVPNDPRYKELQWNLPLIDIEKAWDIQPRPGESMIVAVIDTGVAFMNATIRTAIMGFRGDNGVLYPPIPNATIPYAAATQLATDGRFVAPRDFPNNTSTPLDFDGHGTHVSGTVGQLTNDNIGVAGVAGNVKLMPLKVLCSQWDVLFGTPAFRCDSDDLVAQAIRYAADNGANVINMSFGRDSASNCATSRNAPGCAPAIEDAMNYAVSKGVFISVSAGNEFQRGNPTQTPAEIASRIKGAVSVAAVGLARNHAPYSSSGSWVELAAPGGGAGIADTGYVFQQTFSSRFTDTFDLPVSLYTAPRFDIFADVGYAGTSMAAPHVAGVAAMLMHQGITSPAAVEDALEKTAIDLGTPGRDNLYGFGLIDARNALFGKGVAK
jgi:serine protease